MGNLNNWLQLVANFGLLVGLVLVGIEIKLSNDYAYASLATAAYQQETDHSLAVMGENPSAALTKGFLSPQDLTPEEIYVVLAKVNWRVSMMTRNARMEELGIFNNSWHSLVDVQGRAIGQTPIAREYLLNQFGDDARWYVKRMIEVATQQPKRGTRDFIQTYIDVAESYSYETEG